MMAYKIAVASSDGQNIDVTFGGAGEFIIYEVKEDRSYIQTEIRKVFDTKASGQENNCGDKSGCGTGTGCKSQGCGGMSGDIPQVEKLSDCRCIICKKIGFRVQKQLEKKAIVSFDVECGIEEALNKITLYFERLDQHKTLRGIAHEN